MMDKWFVQKSARCFLKVPALLQAVASGAFSRLFCERNHLARQVSRVHVPVNDHPSRTGRAKFVFILRHDKILHGSNSCV